MNNTPSPTLSPPSSPTPLPTHPSSVCIQLSLSSPPHHYFSLLYLGLVSSIITTSDVTSSEGLQSSVHLHPSSLSIHDTLLCSPTIHSSISASHITFSLIQHLLSLIHVVHHLSSLVLLLYSLWFPLESTLCWSSSLRITPSPSSSLALLSTSKPLIWLHIPTYPLLLQR